MALTNQQKNHHLMWRAGFGPSVEQLADLSAITPAQLYKALQKAAAKKPDYFDMADDYLKGLFMGAEEIGRMEKKELPKEDRKKIQQKNKDSIRSLNLRWLNEMVNTDAQLREKMAFFWHGHFACRNLNVFYQQGLIDIIRNHSLGSFRTMLHEVSKSAAMLNFLNAQQNKKGHPNENFAREVMELFTLGRGHYSEQDIVEAARAFTGWTSNLKGEFIFRKNQHDAGSKTVLGKTGNLGGEEVLDILLEQKQTATYLTEKIYRFFVNDTIDKAKTGWLADRFFNSGYDISKLMEDIFTSDWFYESKNAGVKIKSPIELVAGMQRMLPMEFKKEEALLIVQRVLGQVLFYPPNVAGWPGGKTWIDASTLMMRMRIPQMIAASDDLTVQPKDDDDQMMGMKNAGNNKLNKNMLVDIDWKDFVRHFESVPKENLADNISKTLLQTPKGISKNIINKYSDINSREAYIRTTAIQLMSTPEYQLC